VRVLHWLRTGRLPVSSQVLSSVFGGQRNILPATLLGADRHAATVYGLPGYNDPHKPGKEFRQFNDPSGANSCGVALIR